jgi:hypothetical protein
MFVRYYTSKQNHQHPGNKRYRKLVEHTAPLYERAATKLEKTQVIAAVVRKVRDDARAFHSSNDSGVGAVAGGFVKKDYQTGLWYDIGDDKARDKVGHAIRRVVEDAKKTHKKKNIKSTKLRHGGKGGSTNAIDNKKMKPQHLLSGGSENEDDDGYAHNFDRGNDTSPFNDEKLNALLNQFLDSPQSDGRSNQASRKNLSMGSSSPSSSRLVVSRKSSEDLLQPSFVSTSGTGTRAQMGMTTAPVDVNNLALGTNVAGSQGPVGMLSRADNMPSMNVFAPSAPGEGGMTSTGEYVHPSSAFFGIGGIGNTNTSDLQLFQNQLMGIESSLSGINPSNPSASAMFSLTDATPYGQITSQNIGGTVGNRIPGGTDASFLNRNAAYADFAGSMTPNQLSTERTDRLNRMATGPPAALLTYLQERQQELRGGGAETSISTSASDRSTSNQNLSNMDGQSIAGAATSQNYDRLDYGMGGFTRIGIPLSMPSSFAAIGRHSQGQIGGLDHGFGQLRRSPSSGFNIPPIMAGHLLLGGGNSDFAANSNVSNLNLTVINTNIGSGSAPISMSSSLGAGARAMSSYTSDETSAPIGLENWEEAVKRDDFDESGETP